MHIFINDSPTECTDDSTLSEVLIQQGIAPVNIAIAVNDTVIPKAQWSATRIEEGNNIIIIKAVQGG